MKIVWPCLFSRHWFVLFLVVVLRGCFTFYLFAGRFHHVTEERTLPEPLSMIAVDGSETQLQEMPQKRCLAKTSSNEFLSKFLSNRPFS